MRLLESILPAALLLTAACSTPPGDDSDPMPADPPGQPGFGEPAPLGQPPGDEPPAAPAACDAACEVSAADAAAADGRRCDRQVACGLATDANDCGQLTVNQLRGAFSGGASAAVQACGAAVQAVGNCEMAASCGELEAGTACAAEWSAARRICAAFFGGTPDGGDPNPEPEPEPVDPPDDEEPVLPPPEGEGGDPADCDPSRCVGECDALARAFAAEEDGFCALEQMCGLLEAGDDCTPADVDLFKCDLLQAPAESVGPCLAAQQPAAACYQTLTCNNLIDGSGCLDEDDAYFAACDPIWGQE